MKKLPLGIQNFREIIAGNYVYADKTRYIYDIANGAKFFFLSRPRRFGKSLLLDTLAEAFGGDKELFNGLWIYDSDYSFEKHPVLRFDMSSVSNETPEVLKRSLSEFLLKRAVDEGLEISASAPSDIFKFLVEALRDKYEQEVVVLIDEYDKPILDHITNIKIAEANRAVLKGFYGILKSMDPYLRLTFITGVTKFTKTSIFSELNNLFDITMVKDYANICGIPVEDLSRYFADYIEYFSSLDDFRHIEDLESRILSWYDGYSWDGLTRVINPFSLLSFFAGKRFESFWYSSGTPTFLINLLKSKPDSFLSLRNLEMRERVLDSFDMKRMEAEPLLFQAGYLTVSHTRFVGDAKSYILKMPNFEVREAFCLNLIAEFTEKGETYAESAYRRMSDALLTGDLQSLLEVLRALFAAIPYELHVSHESYYHSIFYAIMNLLGFDISAEVSVSGGRIDAVLELPDKVYVIEFKYEKCDRNATRDEKRELFDKALEDGIKQLSDRGYSRKYLGSGKAVYQAAFAFLGRDDVEMRII